MDRVAASLAGRYRIERELGAGGMATVYLAEDLKHGRKVAIKVLKPELAAVIGAERFVREIRTIAALQHSHILGLIDSGEADGTAWYVMPFVEGESLRDRLKRDKQIPVDEAVRIATEVASALDYAHRHGVIHRDVQPENILLHEGQALVADFGIALAVSSAGGSARMTETGMSLGTPQYMSPEQAMGEREIGPASDVYALGAVTYEMLIGEPPFSGPTAQSIVAKVMTEQPAGIIARRGRVPHHVEDAVLTALEKLPADRYANAAEFGAALSTPAAGPRRVAQGSSPTGLQRYAGVIVGALALLAVVAIIAAIRRPSAPAPPVNRFSIGFGSEGLAPNGGSRVTWSPDGRAFAYIGAGVVGGTRVWLRTMDALTPTPIAGTEGATSVFFSPDGSQVGFILTTPFSLRVVPRSGGQSRAVVTEAVSGGGGAWSTDGYICVDGASTLSRLHPDGTGRETLYTLDSLQQEIGVAWPEVLPHSRAVLFRVRRAGEDVSAYRIYLLDLKTRQHKVLVNAIMARYVSPGYLLYVLADGSLMGSRFDLDRLELAGTPVLIARGVGIAAFGAADLAVSPTGSLLYSTDRGSATTEPVWLGRDGTASPVDSAWHGLFIASEALSPDGSRLAVHLNAPSGGSTSRTEAVWVKQLPTGPLSRLTFEGEQNGEPSWSADGRDILFLSSRSGPPALYRQRADGRAPAERVAGVYNGLGDGFESPDGHWIIARSATATPGDGDILAMRIGTDTALKPLIATGFQELAPALSPDGHWLAYTSNETGRPEVYVRPFPNVEDGKYPVSTGGGTGPRWSHRGDELFYRALNNDFMAVELRLTPPTLGVAGQKRLFSAAPYAASEQRAMYDVSPDDRRFLMLRIGSSAGETGGSQLVLVQNFPTELHRLLP
jgi:serine/threonine-protein kinase